MTKENIGQTSTSAIEKGLGMIERAWNIPWALMLICAVLFFDMAMMVHSGHGLCQWSAEDATLFRNVGWIAIMLASFSFIVAIFMPLFLVILRQASELMSTCLPTFPLISDNRPYRRPLGVVLAHDLLDLALREKDNFLFQLYQTHQQTKRSDEQTREQLAKLAAMALLAAIADWALQHWISGSVSLINGLFGKLGDKSPFVVIGAFLYVGGILKWAWFPKYSPDTIYYPPLDQELRDAEKKFRDEEKIQKVKNQPPKGLPTPTTLNVPVA